MKTKGLKKVNNAKLIKVFNWCIVKLSKRGLITERENRVLIGIWNRAIKKSIDEEINNYINNHRDKLQEFENRA